MTIITPLEAIKLTEAERTVFRTLKTEVNRILQIEPQQIKDFGIGVEVKLDLVILGAIDPTKGATERVYEALMQGIKTAGWEVTGSIETGIKLTPEYSQRHSVETSYKDSIDELLRSQ